MSKDKHEMLFTDYQINYSKIPSIMRRGTIFLRMLETDIVAPVEDNEEEKKSDELEQKSDKQEP